MFDRITIDPQVCDGRPAIRGIRITVDFLLKLLGDGYSVDDIVREYPEVEKEDVFQGSFSKNGGVTNAGDFSLRFHEEAYGCQARIGLICDTL